MSDRSALALGLLPDQALHRSLLSSIVEAARAIFDAQASSIFLFDEQADELVFEAVSGQGEQSLIGHRFPSSTGIAGWVMVTGQPLALDDVTRDPRFSAEAAQATGYVPRAIMAVPLISYQQTLGVLEVLDRGPGGPGGARAMDMLGFFARQAAIGLDLFLHAQKAKTMLDDGAGDLSALSRLSAALDTAEPNHQHAALNLVSALAELLEST